MTPRVSLCLLLLLPACLALAAPPPAPEATATAERMFRAWVNVDWGAAHPEWLAEHPSAACRRPSTRPSSRVDAWCFSCTETDADVVIESRFHVLDPARDRACRLLDVTIHAEAAKVRVIQAERGYDFAESDFTSEIVRQLEARLHVRYPGVPVETKSSWLDLNTGIAHDDSIRIWQTDGRIYYVREDDETEPDGFDWREPPRVFAILRAIESRLTDDRRTDREGDEESPAPLEPPWRTELRERLGAALEREFPRAARLIEQADPETPGEERRHLVLDLLAAAEDSLPQRRAMLWLAADQLAAGFEDEHGWTSLEPVDADDPGRREPPEDWDPGIPGLTFELEHSQCFIQNSAYHHDLLHRIWNELPHGEWRELAFLELQNGGWYFGWESPNPLKFEAVIAHGEAYLAEHPESPHRAAQLLLLAQAHETRWTVGRMKDPPALHGDAEQARAVAEAYYRKLVAEFPGSAEARQAEPRLVRLETDLPPDQWKFFGDRGI